MCTRRSVASCVDVIRRALSLSSQIPDRPQRHRAATATDPRPARARRGKARGGRGSRSPAGSAVRGGRCAPPAELAATASDRMFTRFSAPAPPAAGAGRVEVGCSPPNITFLTECNIFRCRAHSGDHNALSYGMPSIGYLIWARVLTPPDRLWRYYRVRRTVGEICRRRPRARWCRGCVEGAPTW